MTDLVAELDRLDPAREWEPWRPGPGDPWGLKWAGHLYRRAAFGGSWPELKAAVKAGPDAAVEALFAGGPGQAEFDQLMDAVAPGQSAGLALGPDHTDAGANRWLLTRVERATLAQALRIDLAPRVLRLDPALPLGHVRDLEPLAHTLPPERHRGYAVQWFGLAFATLVVALLLTYRSRRRP